MFKQNNKGLTLIELMVTVAVLSIVLAGIYTVYVTTARHSAREYKIAESEMELEIVKNFIERDIAMAGYGLAENYDYDEDGVQEFTPIAIGATDGGVNAPDTLTLMGTAVARLDRATQGWTHVSSTTPTYQTWGDAREDLVAGDMVMFMEPSTKALLVTSGTTTWEFPYLGGSPDTIQKGTLVYGLETTSGSNPYYAVEYSLGGTPPDVCASGTQNLQRAESRNLPLSTSDRTPLLACVLDFQVAFGLDTNEDGSIDFWDDGGTIASLAPYTNPATLRERLKQVRIYMLVQLGGRNPDADVYPSGTVIRVGDTTLPQTIGRDITLTTDQRRYRWRVVSLNITPKNLR